MGPLLLGIESTESVRVESRAGATALCINIADLQQLAEPPVLARLRQTVRERLRRAVGVGWRASQALRQAQAMAQAARAH
jgi:hypothetical protein